MPDLGVIELILAQGGRAGATHLIRYGVLFEVHRTSTPRGHRVRGSSGRGATGSWAAAVADVRRGFRSSRGGRLGVGLLGWQGATPGDGGGEQEYTRWPWGERPLGLTEMGGYDIVTVACTCTRLLQGERILSNQGR
jgi:hypothetical protein